MENGHSLARRTLPTMVITVALVAVLAGSAVGCSSDPIIGTWIGYSYSTTGADNAQIYSEDDLYLEVSATGTATYHVEDTIYTGSWELDSTYTTLLERDAYVFELNPTFVAFFLDSGDLLLMLKDNPDVAAIFKKADDADIS